MMIKFFYRQIWIIHVNNIMKFKDDEHLGGRVSAETDFADIPQFDDEDDDDL